jgi:hypothetical protein
VSEWRLYRCFDSDGVLLYVGMSRSLGRRLEAHAKGSVFAPWLARVDIDGESHETRESVRAAEVLAIMSEDPVFNCAEFCGAAAGRWASYLQRYGLTAVPAATVPGYHAQPRIVRLDPARTAKPDTEETQP